MRYYNLKDENKPVVQVHIADIHFGAINPKTQFDILREQFLIPISQIAFDILAIDGDIFDKKFMANSDAVYYAMEFVRQCVELCKINKATLTIIGGTESHDAGQLKLFYGYHQERDLDIRIVEHMGIEYIQGLKVLCIPEEYGKGAEYYEKFLNEEVYDTVFMHGTVVGSVYGANKVNLDSPKYPIFDINSFNGCRGPIIAGHVHKAMCLNSYIYYCSNPIRYKYGEEDEKGYSIVLFDHRNGYHYYSFNPIHSFRYDTIDITTLNIQDPNMIIAHLSQLQMNGIDHIRLDVSGVSEPDKWKPIIDVLEKYYAMDSTIAFKRTTGATRESVSETATEEIINKYSDMDFLLDARLSPYEKFVNFINYNKGDQFITVEKLKQILAS